MWILNKITSVKWNITDKEHLKRLLADSNYQEIEENLEDEKEDINLDYDSMEYKELQGIAKLRGLKHTGIKKEDLIKSLKEGE